VTAFLLLMLFWFAADLVFRLRFQFSIRALLVLMVAVAVPCSWLAVEMKKAGWKSGDVVAYDYQLDWTDESFPVETRTLLL
jgi:hypothetical protein